MPLYKNYKHGDDFSLIIPKQYIQHLGLVHIDGVVFDLFHLNPALRTLFPWLVKTCPTAGTAPFPITTLTPGLTVTEETDL